MHYKGTVLLHGAEKGRLAVGVSGDHFLPCEEKSGKDLMTQVTGSTDFKTSVGNQIARAMEIKSVMLYYTGTRFDKKVCPVFTDRSKILSPIRSTIRMMSLLCEATYCVNCLEILSTQASIGLLHLQCLSLVDF